MNVESAKALLLEKFKEPYTKYRKELLISGVFTAGLFAISFFMASQQTASPPALLPDPGAATVQPPTQHQSKTPEDRTASNQASPVTPSASETAAMYMPFYPLNSLMVPGYRQKAEFSISETSAAATVWEGAIQDPTIALTNVPKQAKEMELPGSNANSRASFEAYLKAPQDGTYSLGLSVKSETADGVVELYLDSNPAPVIQQGVSGHSRLMGTPAYSSPVAGLGLKAGFHKVSIVLSGSRRFDSDISARLLMKAPADVGMIDVAAFLPAELKK